MKCPESKNEVLDVLSQYRKWCYSNGNEELYPDVLKNDKADERWFNLFITVTLHSTLYAIRIIAKKLALWPIVGFCAYLRIKTDQWSFEPRQCGYNDAYTILGLYRLRQKNIQGAIEALNESWRVWPCPHNSSFGLKRALADQLERHEEARTSVIEYNEIAKYFKT